MVERLNYIHSIFSFETVSTDIGFTTQLKNVVEEIHLRPEQIREELTPERILALKASLTKNFITVAPDLATFGLAEGHVQRLIDALVEDGAKTESDILIMGSQEFYKVSRSILGPLWSAYVDEVFQTGTGEEIYLFAARDATPLFYVAEGLLARDEQKYHLNKSYLVHVDWNRWFMGQEDELENGQKPLDFSDPLLIQFYKQMGFGSQRMIKIVEPGAWGSAANALKTKMPDQQFELWFMFSHMPEYIYGFLNFHLPDIEPRFLEMINDTAEGLPKAYLRPTELILQNGRVVPSLKGKVLASPFMRVWSWAVKKGAFDAGIDYSIGVKPDLRQCVEKIIELSRLSSEGIWTGVLPRNTLTWTEGEKWRKNWPWGKIPPLK